MIKNNKELKLFVRDDPQAEYPSLIKETVWGTNGALYRYLNVDELFAEKSFPAEYLSFKDKEDYIGGMTCRYRQVDAIHPSFPIVYLTLLAIRSSWQGKKYGQQFFAKAVEHLKTEISAPFFLYAYVEKGHQKSQQLCRKNRFQTLGQFSICLYLKKRKKKHENANLLMENLVEKWRKGPLHISLLDD